MAEVFRGIVLASALIAGCAHHRAPAQVTAGTYTMEIIYSMPVVIERDGTQVTMTLPSGSSRDYRGTIDGNDIELRDNPFNPQDIIVYKGTINRDGTISGDIHLQDPDVPVPEWRLIKK